MAPKGKACLCHSQTYCHAASSCPRKLTQRNSTEWVLHRLRPRNYRTNTNAVQRDHDAGGTASKRSKNPANGSILPCKSNPRQHAVAEAKISAISDASASNFSDISMPDDLEKCNVPSIPKTSFVRTMAKYLSSGLQESLRLAVRCVARLFTNDGKNHRHSGNQRRELRRSWTRRMSLRTSGPRKCGCDVSKMRKRHIADVCDGLDVADDRNEEATETLDALSRTVNKGSLIASDRDHQQSPSEDTLVQKSEDSCDGKVESGRKKLLYQTTRCNRSSWKNNKRKKRMKQWNHGGNRRCKPLQEARGKLRKNVGSRRVKSDDHEVPTNDRHLRKDKLKRTKNEVDRDTVGAKRGDNRSAGKSNSKDRKVDDDFDLAEFLNYMKLARRTSPSRGQRK